MRAGAQDDTREAREGRPRARSERHLCVDCRTALGASNRCDWATAHRVVSLGSRKGRAALLDEVWGPPSARRRARQLAKAGGGGSGVATLLEGCGGCEAGANLEAVAVIIAVGLVVLLVYGLVTWLGRKWQEHQHRLQPTGALLRPARMQGHEHLLGRVVAGTPLVAPASGGESVGYGLELVERGALQRDVTLRLARTDGFEVELADGDRLVVPAGRIRLRGSAERVRGRPRAVELLVAALSRPFDTAEDYPPFPFDEAREVRLRVGDEVDLWGRFEHAVSHADDGGGGAPYRRRATRSLTADGVVDVRIRGRRG